ncbi:MAG: hypothetical protein Sapg2KO_03020 [Saprospiraceae bacterium]
MRDSKVYLVLQKLSNRERGKFLKYIQSPYFNKNKPLIQLFQIIHKDLASSARKPYTKEQVWQKLQGKHTYDDVRFRKYLSDLLKHVENFIALEVFEKKEFQKTNFLLEAIVDRKMENLYSTIKKNTGVIAKNSKIQNADYYLHSYQAYKLLHDIETDAQQKKKISTNFTYLSKALDVFYFSEKLRLNYDAEIWKRIDGNLDADLDHIELISSIVKKDTPLDAPPVSIYYAMFLLNKHPENDQFYFEFKKQLDNLIHFFPSHEAIPIYLAGINYCIRKVNTGENNYLEEVYSLYVGYVRSIVEDSGELSQWTFNNTITIGLRLGKNDWVPGFIEEYGPYINEKHRENSVTYNTASYHFYQKNYEEVIQVLQSIEYDDIYYSLNAKTMLLMTYYETDEYDPISFLLESFRAYLNRNKNIPESKKILYKNLIRITKKLVNLPPNAGTALAKIKQEVQDTKKITSRKWLLEKIEERYS